MNQPKTTRKSDSLRLKILDTFIALLAEEGLEATTLDAIANRLKMRRNHVGYYFPSRASLIEGAVRRALATGQEITAQKMARATSGKKLILAWSLGAFEWLRDYPEHGAVILVFFSHCWHSQPFRDQHSEVLQGGIERVSAALESSFPGKTLEAPLQRIQTFNLGLLMKCLTSGKKGEIPVAIRHCRSHTLEVIAPYFSRAEKK